MRDDLNVVIMFHDELDTERGQRIIKTSSKSIKEKLVPEGLFTYVFFTEIRTDESGKKTYGFITNSDGTTTAKSPLGCFRDLYIPNDLNYVIQKIDEYNNDDSEYEESELTEESDD